MLSLIFDKRTSMNRTAMRVTALRMHRVFAWRILLLFLVLSLFWQGAQAKMVLAGPPHWFPYTNTYRALADLFPLTQNILWNYGCFFHSRYMVKNNTIGHSENPALPFYTAVGNTAAMNSNVMASSNAYTWNSGAIDSWMEGPFHALGILDPALSQTGFGSYRETNGGYQMAGCLDVLRGLGSIPAGVTFPIRWPRAGGVMPLLSYNGNEFPDPLTSCAGYTAPTGAPILIQLGPGNVTPQVTAHSFRQGATALAHCIYDETNYTNPNGSDQSLGRGILNSKDAVVIIPRNPLVSGVTYNVSITANGQTHTHSFVARQGGMPVDFIGVFRPATGWWFMDLNRNGVLKNCVADDCLGSFGTSSDRPVVGDWFGNGITGIGVFQPSTGKWVLDTNGNGVLNACGTDTCLGPFGSSTDIPLVGNWTQIKKSKIGFFQPSTQLWYLDGNGNGVWEAGTDILRGPFGFATDIPVVGDWNGDGIDEIGVFRPSKRRWYLDRNGNGVWNGCNVDICAGPFGQSTDRPIVGAW